MNTTSALDDGLDPVFLENLRRYANYKALEVMHASPGKLDFSITAMLPEYMERALPLVEPSFTYLASLQDAFLEEQFEKASHTYKYFSMFFDRGEDEHTRKLELVAYAVREIALWWRADYDRHRGVLPSEDAAPDAHVPDGADDGTDGAPRRVAAAHTELLSIHSSMPVYDIGETIARGEFTVMPDGAFPTATITGDTAGRLELIPFWDTETNQPITAQHVSMARAADQAVFARLRDQAITIATSFNEETATFFYAMDAYWLEHAAEPDAYVELRIEDLMQYTGKRPVKHGSRYTNTYRPDQIQRAGMMAYSLGYTMVEIERTTVRGKGVRTHYTRLWDVADAFVMKTLDGQSYLESIRYRPNEMFREASFGHRRETALLMSRVLALDYAKMVTARRLGRYYTWLWRDRAFRGQMDAPVSCAKLLERAGVEVLRGRERFARKTLETALDRLEEAGVIAQWLLLNENREPADTSAAIPFARWLNMFIAASPPVSIVNHYRSILTVPKPPITAISGDAHAVSVRDIEARRRERGLSIRQLARESGVDPATLSRLLSGKTRRPRKDALDALEAWFRRG